MTENGVKLVLDDRVVLTEDLVQAGQLGFLGGSRTLVTEKGVQIETNLVFLCVGGQVNSRSFEKNFSHVLTAEKRLRVSATMQVEGYKNVFAIGDCANADLQMALWLESQAGVVSTNIYRQVYGVVPFLSRYFRYPLNIMVIPFGRSVVLKKKKNFLTTSFFLFCP